MLRIGIIGQSGYAAAHWQDLQEVQRSGACRIVANAVIDPERHIARLEQLRGQDVEIFSSALEMFDAMRGKMDAVTIPTGIHTHAELMIAAVQSGYHVYLEKPPAATIQEVDEMLAALRRTGRLCAVGYQALWSQSMAFLKLRIGEGALGEVTQLSAATAWVRRGDYYARNDWAGRLRVGDAWVLDGTMNNPLSHQVANLLYLASPERRKLAVPAAVRAELYAGHDIETEDTAAAEIRTVEGPHCYFVATLCADEQSDPEITVLGTRGTAYRSFDGRVCIRYADGRVEEPAVNDARQGVERFQNFVAAADANDTGLLCSHLEMVRPVTLAVNGAFESARRVRPVPRQYVRVSGQGAAAKTVIAGIDAAIPQAASQGKLFSELGLPWAQPTQAFNVQGYKHFPVQFEAGETKPRGDSLF